MRRWRELLTAAITGLVLAGCAGVPTSGPVRQHDSGDQEVNSTVNVAAVPPARDASPMLIVEGFLHAMGTDQPGFEIARQYLTAEASQAWRPADKTSIYADGSQAKRTATSTEEAPMVTLETILTGTLSPSGEYREGSGGLRHDFGLVRTNDNQWRISKAPDGLLISRDQFTSNYVGLALHFLDAAGTALVPDPRFFAQDSGTLETLARAQLAGPSAWLAPAVRADPGAGVTLERVDLSAQGVANLSLGGGAARLNDAARRNLMAEVTTTLAELPQVTGVQFSVGSTLLPLPETTDTTLTAQAFEDLAPADPGLSGKLLTVRGTGVSVVQSVVPWVEGDEVIAPALTEPGAIAARDDLRQVATVNPDGTRLWVADRSAAPARLLWEGSALLRPDYSRQRELWAIGEKAGAQGFRVFSGAELGLRPITVSEVPTDRVRAFRISPDGARIALVVDGPDVEQVGVARIVRSAAGIRIEDFRPITVSPPAGAGRRLLDVGWSSPTDLMVLVSQKSSSSVVRVDQDSALAEDIGPAEVTGLTELAVVPGRQPVLRGPGAVFRYEGPFNWKLTTQAVEAVSYSG